MTKDTASQRLTIILFKKGTTRDQILRKDVEQLVTMPISPLFDFGGEVRAQLTLPDLPRWLKFVQCGVDEKDLSFWRFNASCLIALSKNDRVFAISFGRARSWIDQEKIVRQFGIVVDSTQLTERRFMVSV